MRPSSREKLLDAAERLIAERGAAAASLRAINAAAGLSPAALHYHFGSREQLIEHLLLRRMPALMARRSALLEALEDRPRAPTARGVAEAMLRPLAELVADEPKGGARYVRCLARLHGEGALDEHFLLARFREGNERALPLLRRALPHLPAELLRLRLDLALEAALQALARSRRLSRRQLATGEVATALVDFVAGGLEAPSRLREARAPAGVRRRRGTSRTARPRRR